MPVGNTLTPGPAPREEWRLSLRNMTRERRTYFGPGSTEGQNFGGGVSYSPLTAGADNAGQYDPCAAFELVPAQRDGTLLFLPWTVFAWEDCPVLGGGRGGAEDVYARARDKLERQSSHLTAQTLWTGDISDAPAATDTLEELAASVTPAADNRRLASDDATLIDGTGSHDLTDAFGYIYDWAASQAGAERVWIHVEPRVLSFLAFYGLALNENGQVATRSLVTNLADHYIIADTGYDGSGPPAQATQTGETWIYVTTPMRFFEGPITPSAADAEQIVDRSINRFRAIVSRLVLAEWDLTLHGAIKVCLPGPGPECSATGS